MKEPQKIIQAVRELRIETNMNQVSFAAKIGKSYGSVQRFESKEPPQSTDLARLVYVAREFKRFDLAAIFKDAALSSVPEEMKRLILEGDIDERNPKKAGPESQIHKRRVSA